MSLLTGFNISLDEVGLLEQASQAAFAGGAIPAGWSVVTPAQLGLSPQYSDGIYFTDPGSGASAIVLQQGSRYVVAFRGTDDAIDPQYFPELYTGAYIHHYDPLLNGLIANVPSGANFAFTGASLGGGATNLMAEIAGSAFGGRFAAAKYVGIASPIIKTAAGILNIGFENDPIYKGINGYADFSSSLDNLVLAENKYMAGNYDGRHPTDAYAHSAFLGFEALGRLSQSVFYESMTPDSVVIFDVNAGLVQDVTPGRENTGAFYLGETVADVITGRNGNDFIEGFGGNDTLNGGAGDDAIDGGAGDDFIDGGVGADQMMGGTGNDIYIVDNVTDRVVENADEGNDTLYTSVSYTLSANLEVLVALGIADLSLNGNATANTIYGNAGNNIIDGGGGADILIGGGGNDIYIVDNVNDQVVENAGAGNDTLYTSVNYTLPANIEVMVLQGVADLQVNGNASDNTIYGNSGNNIIDGRAGADILIGGAGNDIYIVDNVNDQVVENAGEGNDTVYTSVNTTLSANTEVLVLQGVADLQVNGNASVNTIYGNAGNNIIDGGAGADILIGGAGNDVYIVDNVNDQVVENAGAGNDTLYTSVNHTLSADIEVLVLQGSADLQVNGNASVNTIYGNAGNNIIDGGGGADILIGGAGNDIYIIDNAGDVVVENAGEGNDTVYTSVNYTLAANAEVLLLQGSSGLQVNGNALANTIYGNGGNNVIDGGGGADFMIGGGGNDKFVFNSGQANGDTITDFVGNNGAADTLEFLGFGTTGQGATFTQQNASLWQIHSGLDGHNEIITLANQAALSANDFHFL